MFTPHAGEDASRSRSHAGKVADLLQQIANSSNVGGKPMIVESPPDIEPAMLYDSCLLMLFPSFCEYWDVPVTESLGFDKPCLIDNHIFMPEGGGGPMRSFDCDNSHAAFAVIRNTVEDRSGLAHWESRIRREVPEVGNCRRIAGRSGRSVRIDRNACSKRATGFTINGG